MFIELIRLQFLKSFRSASFARSLWGAILIGFVTLILLSYVLGAGLMLETIIGYLAPNQDPLVVLNGYLIYFFLMEFMYRYFLQKLPVVDLESLLHLPLGKAKIIHSLLLRTFISPLTIIALLLFLPITLEVIAGKYGEESAFFWLGSILLVSWTIHWVILWFKQRFEDSLIGILVIFALVLLGVSSTYLGWFNMGELTRPIFEFAMQSPFPILVLTGLMVASYLLAHRFYVSHAYLEDLSQEENIQLANQSIGFLGRFGLPGELANLELKLILRHKKSKSILMLSGFFLAYGLIFYTNPNYQSEDGGISWIYIFVGIFITGIFSIQYGQQFLSWNSANFDFFLTRRSGIESLVRGKYLLLASISVLCFIASVPYVYFGVDILLVHIATFLFNVGVMLHLIIYWSLWKPKPMDLNKGAMFNYEGIGAAQLLIVIPMMGGPYLVYVPFSLLLGDYAGLLALGIVGIAGLLGFKQLSQININKIKSNRHKISSSFRQEL
jgi:hypothetical protein